MSKKIVDLKTISSSSEVEFNDKVLLLIKSGYEAYGEISISFSPTTTSKGLTPGFDRTHGGDRYLTQQFVKYEVEELLKNNTVNLFDLIVADEFILEGKRHKVLSYNKSNPSERVIRAMCLEDLKNYSFVENVNDPIMVDKINL